MRWEHLDLAGGWWTIPGELAKNGRSHRVPLSRPVLAILDEARRWGNGGQELFPSPSRAGSMQYAQKAVERIRKAAGVEFTEHDLRRTAASHMTSMGISRLTVGKLLNHVETGVTAVYDRHSYDREKRDALEELGRRLAEIVTQEDAPEPVASERAQASPEVAMLQGGGEPLAQWLDPEVGEVALQWGTSSNGIPKRQQRMPRSTA